MARLCKWITTWLKNTQALRSHSFLHTAFSSFRRMITGCARNSTSSRGTRLLSAQWTPQAALLQRSPTLPGSTSKWVMCQTFTRRLSSADTPHFLTQLKDAATAVYGVHSHSIRRIVLIYIRIHTEQGSGVALLQVFTLTSKQNRCDLKLIKMNTVAVVQCKQRSPNSHPAL